MGFDKLGRPILATQYGSLRLWEMAKLTTVERMTELHAREQELLLRMLRRRTLEGGGGGEGAAAERAGHIVDTAVVVIDTGGLTLRHVTKAFVRLFKLRAHMDQLLFPEMLGKCFIVNTPSLFSYVWSMFSPLVDERTRSKISIISKPQDWTKALQEIADPDQLSPEYGGTGRRQEDLPSLADALYAAGSRGGSRGGENGSGTGGGAHGNGNACGGSNGYPIRNGGGDGEDGGGEGAAKVGVAARRQAQLPPPEPPQQEHLEDEEEVAIKGSEHRGWFGGRAVTWGPVGWLWSSAWGGGGGGSAGVAEGMREDAEESVTTSDEEVRTYAPILPRGRSRIRSESGGGAGGRDARSSQDDMDVEVGRSASGTAVDAVWRRSWGGTAADLADLSTLPSIGGGRYCPGGRGCLRC
ncbi:unnamed protein product [Ectocarpus sp. 12 AP-2014]